MAWSYQIDPERGIVFSVFDGTTTDADVSAHQKALSADPAFEPGFSQLLDFRGVTSVRLTAAGVRAVAEAKNFGAGSRRAIVVASNVAYGMARMFEILRDPEPDTVEVFRDLAEARRWLGLDGEA